MPTRSARAVRQLPGDTLRGPFTAAVGQLKKICSFTDESYDPAMLSYSEIAATCARRSLKWHRTDQAAGPSQLVKLKTAWPKADRAISKTWLATTLALFGYYGSIFPHDASRALKVYYTLVSATITNHAGVPGARIECLATGRVVASLARGGAG